MMIKNKKFSFWYSIIDFIGIWYSLYYFDILTANLEKYLWPIILIILVCAIISNKASWNKKVVDLNKTCGLEGKDGRLSFNGIFGGIDLIMPEDYNVIVNSFAVFGGNDNKINREFNEIKKTIYINCVSIFGGADIK